MQYALRQWVSKFFVGDSQSKKIYNLPHLNTLFYYYIRDFGDPKFKGLQPKIGSRPTCSETLLFAVYLVDQRKSKGKNTAHFTIHRLRQTKYDDGGSILSSSQFLILLQQPLKMKLAFKVVKINSK